MRCVLCAAIAVACSIAANVVVAVELNLGDLIVATQSSGNLYRVDPLTGNATLISSGGLLFDPSHVLIDPAGNILNAERKASLAGIVRTDPVNGSQTLLASGALLSYPTALAFDNAGGLYVGNHSPGGNRQIVQVSSSGDSSLLGNLSGIDGIQDIDVDSQGRVVVLDFGAYGIGGGQVVRFDPLSGQQVLVSSAGMLVNPTDLLILPSGNFIVSNRISNSETQIIEIDQVTGVQDLKLTVPSSGFMAIQDDGHIYYADFNRMLSVLRADLTTGQTESVSNFVFPRNIVGAAVYNVPEPSTCVLAAVGLVALAIVRRTRRR